ncbi:MAG: CDP-alcohol phosphatidyltransferase family protein [Oscillospiraceae bacterium]|nr:CDP-alcohol phosphatidyltransferase family protein [Oscillospiraceae bacterium]
MKNFKNLPNILSVVRIILIPFFVVSYLNFSEEGLYLLPGFILLLSGFTDFLDGYIARKYGFITYLGKILDPLADKLTQFTVCLVIGFRNSFFLYLAGLYFIKELCMLIGGIWLTKKDIKIAGSKWWGKLGTGMFYAVMLIVILFPTLPEIVSDWLCIGLMVVIVFAFVMYIPEFIKLLGVNKKIEE